MMDQSRNGKPGLQQEAASGNARPDTIDTLESRLDDGFRRIDVAHSRGEDVAAWEDFWIELLHRYESLCDEDRLAA